MSIIEKAKNKLKSDGYVIIEGFFLKTKEYKNFKRFLSRFIKFGLNNEKNKIIDIDKSLSLKFKKDKKISAFLNDYINLSPYLSSLFTSDKLTSFLSKILEETKDKVILNNQRFRIQIPGNDEIANLPWHQDIGYNTIKNTKSIVAWVSLGNISEDMGPIIFKKGSHKFGIQKQIKFKKSNGGTAVKVDLNNVNLKDLIDVQLKTLSGDLILIDMNTVHTSGINRTKDKVKYSAQARYHVVRQHWRNN
mgnify:FL=1